MKRLQWILTLIVVASTAACDDNDSTKTSQVKLRENLETDTWKVTYFFDTQDETYHFTDFVFTFNDDGTVVAARDAQAVNGIWSVSKSSNNKTKLNLDFDITEPFEELNDDWDVIEFTNDVIELKDVSGGSGDTDLLTFERVQ